MDEVTTLLDLYWAVENVKINLCTSAGSQENNQNKVNTQLWDTLYNLHTAQHHSDKSQIPNLRPQTNSVE